MARQYLDKTGLSYLWGKLKDHFLPKEEKSVLFYGQVDSTSTATAFTAQIDGITEYFDGLTVVLKNGVVTSASGFTIDINNLGAKHAYSNMALATAETTLFNINYTMMFVYDSTRVEGGGWILYRGYNANDNTIGYQLRTNSMSLPMKSATWRYRLLFTSADGEHFVPANSSNSTNATTARAVCQDAIDPFGDIRYYGTTASVAKDARPSATALWEQYAIALGYSFNRTGAALTLTAWKPVYVKCAPQSDGSAIIDSTTPYVQDLPTTEDGKIYIYLGVAYSATNIELVPHHPVYWYKNGKIRQYTNADVGVQSASVTQVQTSGTKIATVTIDGTATDVYAPSGGGGGTITDVTVDGTSVVSGGVAAIDLTGKADTSDIPTKVSDLTNDAGYLIAETDPTVPSWAKAQSKPSYTASEVGALPDTTVIPSKTSDLTNDSNYITGMEILSYGSSTWQDFIDAYTAKKVVYCRASSNANPASGSQTRLAFMAYVNNAANPTEVEFQYYRSVSSHSASQQGDQVYVYKLTNSGTWTVTTREAYTKIAAGTGLSSSYSNGTLTLTSSGGGGGGTAISAYDCSGEVGYTVVDVDTASALIYVITLDTIISRLGVPIAATIDGSTYFNITWLWSSGELYVEAAAGTAAGLHDLVGDTVNMRVYYIASSDLPSVTYGGSND